MNFVLFYDYLKMDGHKSQEINCQRKLQHFRQIKHKIFLKETPGHSKGSICILVDEKILFSGDTLVTGHETILRLPGGSKKDFAGITLPYLESLDREIMVYPGHGEPQKLAEFMK